MVRKLFAVTFVLTLIAAAGLFGLALYADKAAADCTAQAGSQGGVVVAPSGVSLDSTGLTVHGAPMDKDQAAVAAKIAGIVHARRRDYPAEKEHGLIVTMLMQGTTETLLRNLDHGTGTSLGVFQETSDNGWGKPEQLMDVTYATNKMLDAILKVPGWQTMSYGVLAQRGERSKYPDRYATWTAEAETTYAHLRFQSDPSGPSQSISTDLSCVSGAGSSAIVDKAIEFAKSRVGDQYVWSGDEPGGFDCSGLMEWSFGKAGIVLPRTSRDQWNYAGDSKLGITTSHVGRADLQRGDLVFWSHDGTPQGIYHVGMYLGGGQMINAANPRTDILVQNMYYSGGFIGGLRISQKGNDDAAIAAAASGSWQSPLKPGSYTRTGDAGQYGMRIHPVTGVPGFHNGVDLAAPVGTPIYAATSGTIVRTGYDSCWGNYMVIKSGPVAVLYPHESGFAVGMFLNRTVTEGEHIGYVGATGCVTGPHLHLSVCTNIDLCLKGSGAHGRGSVDPVRFFASKGVRLQ